MTRMTLFQRVNFLVITITAGYAIVAGVSRLNLLVTLLYTVGFGVLVIFSLVMQIYGWEAVKFPALSWVATVIPLSLSAGLALEYHPVFARWYIVIAVIGLMSLITSELLDSSSVAKILLMGVHGIGGLLLFFLPIRIYLTSETPVGILWLTLGSLFIGLAGIVLGISGKEKVPVAREHVLRHLPVILAITTLAFTAGISLSVQ